MSMRISFCTKNLVNGGVYTAGIALGQLQSQNVILSSQKVEFFREWNFLKAWNLRLLQGACQDRKLEVASVPKARAP